MLLNKQKSNKKRKIILLISVICIISAVIFIAAFSKRICDDNKLTVCLDPGHGGDDSPGATDGGSRYEKDDNLTFAFLVKDELEKAGAEVIMTRESDESVTLEKRCDIANRSHADYCLCLHRNSAAEKSAHGSEVWINSLPSPDEQKLSQNIMEALESAGISQNRGVKKGYRDGVGLNYYINANTNMPACLIELGFISNERDNEDFDTKKEIYARAIADAVIKTYTSKITEKEQ